MFYDGLANDHGLPHDPFKAIVAPRPIGWISSLAPDGTRNLAPYSYFQAVADRPGVVLFSSVTRKDTIRNVEATGEFVCNLAIWELREQVNQSSATVPSDVDEFALTGLTPAPSRLVRPPRVAESPVALECRYIKTVDLPDGKGGSHIAEVVFGLVIGVHIADAAIKDGRYDTVAMRPICRMGYHDYTCVTDSFEMVRPA